MEVPSSLYFPFFYKFGGLLHIEIFSFQRIISAVGMVSPSHIWQQLCSSTSTTHGEGEREQEREREREDW
jgi:hypothetical protein